MNFYSEDKQTAFEAQRQAYWIAFAPMIFQTSRTLINTGILSLIREHREGGIAMDEIVGKLHLSEYKVRVLLHAALGIGLVYIRDDRYCLTKTGVFLLNDKSVRVNLDFTHDVCYEGLFYMEDSIKAGKPEGLKVFGEWNTIYEALAHLPAPVQESWFNLDHYYSDEAFPKAIPLVLKNKPRRIMDIGGNTGKFARKLMEASPSVKISILDLPGQISMAEKTLSKIDAHGQISYVAVNVLDEQQSIPKDHDIIWMSQFLDCFSEEQIISILKRCYDALDENGRVCILEGFWDKQKIETSAFCLQQFSLYFTVMANGNSQMYDYKTFVKCIHAANLEIEEEHHNLSISNSLLICKKRG